MLSKDAVEISHRSGKPDMLSQHAQCRQAIPECTANMYCIKKAAKTQNKGQADSEIAVEPGETCTRTASRTSSYKTLGG